MSEELLQTHVIKYLNIKYPKIGYCASLGGIRTSIRQAVKAKATGYVKGHPDLVIYEPRGKYYGLFIEIKYKGYASKEQKQWINDLNDRGYLACCLKGFDAIAETIDIYLKLTPSKYEKSKHKTKN